MRYSKTAKGFTLIELVIGIVVFSIAMTMVFSVVVPRAQQTIDPIYQVRAAQLATSILNEVRSKDFDENSNVTQGGLRCDETGAPTCTLMTNFGDDGETPAFWDDVDDYNSFNQGFRPVGALPGSGQWDDEVFSQIYNGFQFQVSVVYDGDYNGVADNIRTAKLITVSIQMPNSEVVTFAAYRSNY